MNFDGADLNGINLLEARELEIVQLVRAKTLYKAKLDPDMLKMIRERSPHLLKNPGRD